MHKCGAGYTNNQVEYAIKPEICQKSFSNSVYTGIIAKKKIF